jgi:hypothetical protein
MDLVDLCSSCSVFASGNFGTTPRWYSTDFELKPSYSELQKSASNDCKLCDKVDYVYKISRIIKAEYGGGEIFRENGRYLDMRKRQYDLESSRIHLTRSSSQPNSPSNLEVEMGFMEHVPVCK